MQTPKFESIASEQVDTYGPGVAPPEWRPGDFILTHGDAFVSRLIRFGERLRIHGDDRRFCWFSHAALVTSADGDLTEALSRGVVATNASKYLSRHYVVVRPQATEADCAEVLAFARWVLDNRSAYGWLTVVSIALTVLTGSKFTFFVDGEFICSGFVARAMERTGAIFSRDPVHLTPADLAKYYVAEPPPGQAG